MKFDEVCLLCLHSSNYFTLNEVDEGNNTTAVCKRHKISYTAQVKLISTDLFGCNGLAQIYFMVGK